MIYIYIYIYNTVTHLDTTSCFLFSNGDSIISIPFQGWVCSLREKLGVASSL